MATVERLDIPPPPPTSRPVAPLTVAVPLLAVAAAMHVYVTPQHLSEWRLAGVFFLLVAAGQGTLAAALMRSRRAPLVLVAIWSNVGLVALYVWSRTSGLPFGPLHSPDEHGHVVSHANHAVGGRGNGIPVFPDRAPTRVEPVGALDFAVVGVELAAIAILLTLLPARARSITTTGLAALAVVMVALRTAGRS